MLIRYQTRGILLILALLLITSCGKQDSAITEPTRPPQIPATSVWVGGLDGGVFVVVNKASPHDDSMYHGEVYYTSGDLAYKGPMKIFPNDSAEFDLTRKESYAGWDGDTLYLRDKQYLKIQQ